VKAELAWLTNWIASNPDCGCPLPLDYVRLQHLIGSQSKRVFPNLACSLADADRLTEELPGLLAQKGFGSIHMKNRSFAIGETVDTVYFVDLASGLEDPMAFSLCRRKRRRVTMGEVR
jgi:hypothetical protein